MILSASSSACMITRSRSWLMRRACLISSGTVTRSWSMMSRNSCSSMIVRDESGSRVPELTSCSRRSINCKTSMISPPYPLARQPTRYWCRLFLLCQLLTQCIGDKIGNKPLDSPAELDNLLDQACAEEAVLQTGNEKNFFYIRRQRTVHERHLGLDLIIGDRAEPTHNHPGARLASKLHQEAPKGPHLDIADTSQRLLGHGHALCRIEHEGLGGRIVYRDDHVLEDLGGTPRDINVPHRNRIKRPRIYRRHGHDESSLPRHRPASVGRSSEPYPHGAARGSWRDPG